MKVIIDIEPSPSVSCGPNKIHGGTVVWAMSTNDRLPKCPVCGRYA